MLYQLVTQSAGTYVSVGIATSHTAGNTYQAVSEEFIIFMAWISKEIGDFMVPLMVIMCKDESIDRLFVEIIAKEGVD